MAAPYYIEGLVAGVSDDSNLWRWNRADPLGSPVKVTYSFFTSVPDYADSALHPKKGDASDANFHEFTLAQRAAAEDILAQYAGIANLTFQDKGDDQQALMHFGGNYQADSYAYAYLPYPNFAPAGDVWLGQWQSMTRVGPGQIGYSTLIHEIGHALGLKHPFETEAGGSQVTLSGFEDSEQYTVMSYTLHPHSLFTQLGADGQIHYRDIEPSTPMLYDIAAVQYLYGANMQTRAGDDVYRFSPSKPFLECIWDGGGSDTISVAAFTLGCTVDLRAGHFSDLAILPAPVDMPGWKQPTYDGTDNLSIAYGATIENATGGHGGDMLIGNDAANALRGAGGDDTLSGGPGADRLTGGAGADTFVFDGPAAAGDFVTDFNPGEGDTLQLDGAAFGNLPAEQLLAGGYLVYDGATGKLYYDAGADGLDVTLLAKLAGHPALDAGDIHVT